MTLENILALAHKYMSCSSSHFCLCQAQSLIDRGDPYNSARMWAIRSLSYSIGILHPDYQRASSI
jgi:hypothetical protein